MPVMGGDDLLDELRRDETPRTTSVLVLSARADDADRLDLVRKDANDYLVMPFSVEGLLVRAASLIALRHAELRAQMTLG